MRARSGCAAACATAAIACGSVAPKRTFMRVSISASRSGLGGISAHANAAGDEPSILAVGTCSMPRCDT